jgi:hypothetical protein
VLSNACKLNTLIAEQHLSTLPRLTLQYFMCTCLSQQVYEDVTSSSEYTVEAKETQCTGVTSEAADTEHVATVEGDQAAAAQTMPTTQPQGSCCAMS